MDAAALACAGHQARLRPPRWLLHAVGYARAHA
jgi:hypothetical protein